MNSSNNNVTVLILGGGQGKRLFPLTSYRSKPAVPIGGKYRLVDIPISNSINSGFRRIFVLTQFNSTSLHRHIHRTYPYEFFHQTSVELLAAEQTPSTTDWFQGTADAVRKHIPHYHLEETDTVVILSGDHLYRMNYQDILRFHEERGADVTVSTFPVPKKQVKHFGIMQVRRDGRITAFREKPPPQEKGIRSFIIPEMIRGFFHVRGPKEMYLASMGIYVFKAKVLIDVLAGQEADFGKEVIPKSIHKYKVYGYIFNGYWRDIGTIGSFYEASIDLTKGKPSFSFLSPKGVIFTRARFLPPSKIKDAKLENALMAEGCILDGVTIKSSVIGLRSVISKGTTLVRSVLMGNDFYDPDQSQSGRLGIGRNCRIENCILDKNVYIGNNVVISNRRGVREENGANYSIRDGIVIIPKDTVIPDGTVI